MAFCLWRKKQDFLASRWSSRYFWTSKRISFGRSFSSEMETNHHEIKLMRKFSFKTSNAWKEEGNVICCQNDSWSRTSHINAITELMACYFIQFSKSLFNASFFFLPRIFAYRKISHHLYFWIHNHFMASPNLKMLLSEMNLSKSVNMKISVSTTT